MHNYKAQAKPKISNCILPQDRICILPWQQDKTRARTIYGIGCPREFLLHSVSPYSVAMVMEYT